MEEIKLVIPAKAHEEMVANYLREHRENGEQDIHGGSLIEKAPSYGEWLEQVQGNSDEKTVHPDWVVSSTFFGVRESDGWMVGMIDIRHRLNDFLRSYGGHIGYGVRPSERGKGYATGMLRLGLGYCKTLGLPEVMLACDKDNSASAKTIMKCGGILEREFCHTDGKTVQVYWINRGEGQAFDA